MLAVTCLLFKLSDKCTQKHFFGAIFTFTIYTFLLIFSWHGQHCQRNVGRTSRWCPNCSSVFYTIPFVWRSQRLLQEDVGAVDVIQGNCLHHLGQRFGTRTDWYFCFVREGTLILRVNLEKAYFCLINKTLSISNFKNNQFYAQQIITVV